MRLLCLAFLSIYSLTIAAQENQLKPFENLINSTWVSEGEQLGGHQGKTVKEFDWGLNGKLVKVKTWTTDPKTLEFGLRNEGVRLYNADQQEIVFYEFDKLGGISKGVVKIEGCNIHYEYTYGDLLLRDSWIYISKDEYQYRVCSIKEEACDQVYHQGIFKRK